MTHLSTFTVFATTRIMQLAAINLFAFCLIALGFGVFGLAPAMVATLWAAGRLEEKGVGALIGGMWAEYRREFLRSNLLVLPALALSSILIALALIGGGLLAGIWIALAVMAFQFATAALVMISRMSGSVADAAANTCTATSMAPFRLLAAVALIPTLVLVVLWQPMLGLYFACSGWALGTTLIMGPTLASATPSLTHDTEVLP